MSETPRDAVEKLKQDTAAQLDFAADLRTAIAQVRKKHGLETSDTPRHDIEYASEALALDFAFRLAETRNEELDSPQDATDAQLNARAPLIYDDLLDAIEESIACVRHHYAATGNDVLVAAALWREEISDLFDEATAAGGDDEPDAGDEAPTRAPAEQLTPDVQSRMIPHPALNVDVPAFADDETVEQLAADGLHVAFARLHTAINGPNAPMHGCCTDLPDAVLLALYGQHGRPEDGFQINLPNLTIDDRASVSAMACSLAVLVHRLITPLAHETRHHLHDDDQMTSQRDAITALALVPWIVADGLQTFTDGGERNLVQHATTASKIAGKEVPDGIRTMRAQGSRHHH
ncbi:hypothetical protein CKO28_01090 [Rhodovibrio sodomensis]|uniref:Uncharacterized protein n=2 Tax=Rhodovibrio sodomensis TaxID=1088 RepID=A0ABS1DA67_9PROT|nr:hypothetical protein [Rhodovibrio sodomensis]